MVKYGYYYGGGFLAGGLVLGWLAGNAWWGLPLYLGALFCLNFFRDPDRDIPEGPFCVSPADGKVVAVLPSGPAQSRISIFLNVFDVHVNRTPIPGTVTKVEYRKGKFLVASGEGATTHNEQNFITVENQGTTVMFSQIAGLIARRIICYVRPGDVLAAGQRIGLIKFGSRVDVFLGPEWEISVSPGQRVKAGSSILARRRGN